LSQYTLKIEIRIRLKRQPTSIPGSRSVQDILAIFCDLDSIFDASANTLSLWRRPSPEDVGICPGDLRQFRQGIAKMHQYIAYILFNLT